MGIHARAGGALAAVRRDRTVVDVDPCGRGARAVLVAGAHPGGCTQRHGGGAASSSALVEKSTRDMSCGSRCCGARTYAYAHGVVKVRLIKGLPYG